MVKCEKCGMEVDAGNKFCTCCGSLMPIDGVTAETPATAAAPAPTVVPIAAAAEEPAAPAAAPAAAADPAAAPAAPPQPAIAYQQVPLQAPNFFATPSAPVVGVGSWLGSLLLVLLIPLAVSIVCGIITPLINQPVVTDVLSIISLCSGLIVMIIFAFSGKVNPSKRNFFRAALILSLILIALIVVLCVVAVTLLSTVLAEMGLDATSLEELMQQLQQLSTL